MSLLMFKSSFTKPAYIEDMTMISEKKGSRRTGKDEGCKCPGSCTCLYEQTLQLALVFGGDTSQASIDISYAIIDKYGDNAYALLELEAVQKTLKSIIINERPVTQ